jgi:ABC-type Zn uptake system ZnuABC Zn-binding protein ZnuA
MKKAFIIITLFSILVPFLATACQGDLQAAIPPSGLKVIAVETFLADIAQNVAGGQVKIQSLIPIGLDPHAFEPTPKDVIKILNAQLVIANGAGFEEWLQKVIENSGGKAAVIEASFGLQSRKAREGEEVVVETNNLPNQTNSHLFQVDPHFWLDPLLVIKYVENIRDGLIQVDPQSKGIFTKNAEVYISQLKELDQFIQEQVSTIPAERRMIVTNHESFGYFADRYGFKVIGTIIPSVSTGSSPSARELASLIDQIQRTKVVAIFLETGTNPQMAEQVSIETGIKVINGLLTHSITEPGGIAPTYIDMMKYNVTIIVDALK